MKKALLAICLTLAIFRTQAQDLTRVRLVDTFEHYTYGMSASKDRRWIGLNVAYIGRALLDSQLKTVKYFPLTTVYGGSSHRFTFQDQFYCFTKNGTIDTLLICDLKTLQHKQYLMQVESLMPFYNTSKLLLCTGGKFSVMDLQTRKTSPLCVIPGMSGGCPFNQFVISHNDSLIFTNKSNRGPDILIYDIKKKKWTGKIATDAGDEVLNMTITRDGKYLLYSVKQDIFMYDIAAGKIVHRYTNPNSYVGLLTISPDGKYLFSSGGGGELYAFLIADGSMKTFKINEENRVVADIYFGENGKLFVCASNKLYEYHIR
ncbi:MAG: hypothetical protein JNL57_10395 [Bacteroidetes bacterium]|nr:hypothetical protein [Bacteroidota bacterium]